MGEGISNLGRIEDLLEQILAWTRVGMYGEAKQLLQDQFGSARAKERMAYELLDGEKSQTDVLVLCTASLDSPKISKAALSNWVAKWEKLGLVKKEGRSVKRLFSLQDFGFDVQPVKAAETAES